MTSVAIFAQAKESLFGFSSLRRSRCSAATGRRARRRSQVGSGTMGLGPSRCARRALSRPPSSGLTMFRAAVRRIVRIARRRQLNSQLKSLLNVIKDDRGSPAWKLLAAQLQSSTRFLMAANSACLFNHLERRRGKLCYK